MVIVIRRYNADPCLSWRHRPPRDCTLSNFCGICVPPTVNYLQCLATGSTLSAVGLFQLLVLQYGTLEDFIRDPTVSADCFRRLLKTYLFARY